MRLEEQDFKDRGVSSLDESKKFSYTIGKESAVLAHATGAFRPWPCRE